MTFYERIQRMQIKRRLKAAFRRKPRAAKVNIPDEANIMTGAEHHSDKGYAESTHEKQAEFARKRNRSTNV